MTNLKKRKAIIFGTGSFAEVADFYLTVDSDYEVVCFTATEASEASEASEDVAGRPVVPFDEIEAKFPPSEHDMFIAVGYAKMNSIREKFMKEAEEKGYTLLSYVCSKVTHWPQSFNIGKNVFIFEDNTIQPFTEIGDGTILWSGNHIGHHTTIGPNCFITSHVVVSGHCKVGANSFVGVNATISDGVTVGERNLIGPASLIQKDTEDSAVYVSERAKKLKMNSDRFFK